MTNLELEQLERLLTKYHLETESPLGLSNIRPCLSMVKEKLALIGGGYSTAEKEYLVDLKNECELNSLENQSNEC